MKIGLDYHGVINDSEEFFKIVTKCLVKEGHEIHIITGLTETDFLKVPEDISYTHFFSITDTLLNKDGVPSKLDKNGRATFPNYDWETAKANYCEKNKIDIMIDDTDKYSNYFTTTHFILWNRRQ